MSLLDKKTSSKKKMTTKTVKKMKGIEMPAFFKNLFLSISKSFKGLGAELSKLPLWKILVFTLLFIFALSWLIPTSKFDGATLTTETVSPLGLLDLVRIPLVALTDSLSTVMLILAVGGFYGILNKIGVYSKLVGSLVNYFKGDRFKFAVIAASLLLVISALTSANLLLFIPVPFLAAVLLKLKYGKLTTLLTTVGAIIIGNFASLYSFKINGFINYYFSLDVNNNLAFKLTLLVVGLGLLLFAIYNDKSVKETKNIPLYKENNAGKNRSVMPLVIIFGLVMILLLVATYNWFYGASEASAVKFFDTLYTNISNIKVGDYAPIMNIIGNVNPLGWWAEAEIVIILVLASALLGWIYSMKFNDIIYSFIDGMKEMMIPAFYAALSFIVIAAISVTDGVSIATTVLHYVMSLTKGFSAISAISISLVGGLFYNTSSSVVEATSTNIIKTVTDVSQYPVYGFAYQTIHSLLMLILPTSTLLVIGLAFFKVSFFDWIKSVWLLVLELLALAVIVIVTLSFIL